MGVVDYCVEYIVYLQGYTIVFRPHDQHRQSEVFSVVKSLPEKRRSRLEASWAATFYRECFCRIDERLFERLYSDKGSRPNTPVNMLVAAEVLKSGFGWSDEELYDNLQFDLQARYALGVTRLETDVFELRTLYNFRRRVREHAERTGENLIELAMAQVTDAQRAAHGIAAGWQRMDSTQVLSNIAVLHRLELVVTTVQQIFRRMKAAEQAVWEERLGVYLSDRAQRICYRIPPSKNEFHLERLGEMVSQMAATLGGKAGRRAARLLESLYERTDEGVLRLKPVREIAAGSLQSPHDEEATYREKGGRKYQGYVVGVSETCSPDNPVQLVTDVVVAPNTTDDGALLASTLQRQAERGIEILEVTVDGGFTGPVGEGACREHGVKMHPTRIRGGQTKAGRFGWKDYEWQLDANGEAVNVCCPQGQTARLQPSKDKHLVAYFDVAGCSACPFFKGPCRTVKKPRGARLYVPRRSVTVARLRQGMRDVDRSVRAVVESTILSIKNGLEASKLPVRGQIRAQMHMSGSAMMVNVRRLHRWIQSLRTPDGVFDLYRRLLDVLSVVSKLFVDHPGKLSPVHPI